jgi:hypothetical protein
VALAIAKGVPAMGSISESLMWLFLAYKLLKSKTKLITLTIKCLFLS